MPAIQVSGQTIYYETVSESVPQVLQSVLLLHGWGQVVRDMRPLAEALAPCGYRFILIDRPGYGQSTPPFRTYPPDFYHRDARIIAAFLDALGLSDVHIMGFSDGGEVALLLPILRPDLCRSVVAWGAIGHFGQELCDSQRRGLPQKWVYDPAWQARHPGQDITAWPYQWVQAICAIVEAGGDVSLRRAGEIRCPLFLLLGDHDALNPVTSGWRFIEAASGGRRRGLGRIARTLAGRWSPLRRFQVFPGVGHAIHEERPAEFISVVQDFLKAVT